MRRVDSLEKTLCWEGLGAGGEGDDRGWDGWMASRTRWTWVWVNSGSWWWTGRPGVLRFMGSQRVGHDWVTELNWTEGRYEFDFISNWQFSKVIVAVRSLFNTGGNKGGIWGNSAQRNIWSHMDLGSYPGSGVYSLSDLFNISET